MIITYLSLQDSITKSKILTTERNENNLNFAGLNYRMRLSD